MTRWDYSGPSWPKKGAHHYYFNKHHKIWIRAEDIETAVFGRLKERLAASEKMKQIIELALQNRKLALPVYDEEISDKKSRLKESMGVMEKFSDTIRKLALSGSAELTEAIQTLTEERTKAKEQVRKLEDEIAALSKKRVQIDENKVLISLQRVMNLTKLGKVDMK